MRSSPHLSGNLPIIDIGPLLDPSASAPDVANIALQIDEACREIGFFGMFEWPRVRFIGFANNHSIHHRGQLAAYLRALGSKVPDIYGPSADSEKATTR